MSELEKRVDHLDGEVLGLVADMSDLKATVGGLVSTVNGMQLSQRNQDQKLDELLERRGADTATREMIPIKFVISILALVGGGVGTMVSLVTIAGVLVMFAVKSEAKQSVLRDDRLVELLVKSESAMHKEMDLQVSRVEDVVRGNSASLSAGERWSRSDQIRFEDTDFYPLMRKLDNLSDRVSRIEVEQFNRSAAFSMSLK